MNSRITKLISELLGKDVDEVGLVCDIFDKMNRDDQIKVWQYVNEIMEGE